MILTFFFSWFTGNGIRQFIALEVKQSKRLAFHVSDDSNGHENSDTDAPSGVLESLSGSQALSDGRFFASCSRKNMATTVVEAIWG